MIDPKTALDMLKLCNLKLHPTQRYQQDELDILAMALVDELQDWTTSKFLAAAREYRRTKHFVPTSVDLVRAYDSVAEVPQEFVALPEAYDKQADLESCRRWVKKLQDAGILTKWN